VYLSDFRFVPTEKATNPRHFLEDRDILITRLSGTAEYVGNLGVVRELGKRRIQFPDRLFRTRALDPASTDFLELAFQSTSVRQQVANLIRSATGQKRLAISDVSEIRIPVPPEDERDRVVVHASRLLDVIASLGARSGSAQARLEQIRPLSRRLAQDEALVVTDSALERAESGIENLGMAATRSGKPASGLRASTEAMPATNNEYGPPGGRIMQALQEAGGRLDVGTLFKSSGFKVADGVSAGERFYEALREAEQIGLVAEDRAGEAVEVVLSSLRAS
jgi:type I restriction enzyme S subunit